MTVAEIKELILSRGVFSESTLHKLKKFTKLRKRGGHAFANVTKHLLSKFLSKMPNHQIHFFFTFNCPRHFLLERIFPHFAKQKYCTGFFLVILAVHHVSLF